VPTIVFYYIFSTSTIKVRTSAQYVKKIFPTHPTLPNFSTMTLATQLFFVGLMGKYQLSLHIFKIRSNVPGENILHLCWRIRESEKYRYTFKVLFNLYRPLRIDL
jgi:hypothetical protein